MLVTSRRHFRLPGLASCNLDSLDMADAATLLGHLAPRLEDAQAREIASLCGCLPLALRLAGSLLADREDLSVARYIEILRHARLTERTGLSAVATSIRLSEQSLPPGTRSTWRQLAAFREGFRIGGAIVLWQVDRETAENRIDHLRRLSMLSWEADTGQYLLHDLIREYALAGSGEPPFPITIAERLRRYTFDLPLALTLLILWLPVMLTLAALIKLTSWGPAIYSQTRVGLRGRLFIMYKFRSMEHMKHYDKYTKASINKWNNPRATPLGRFMRRTYLDELPQLWNVIRGDMSLIGPRPERPEFVPQLGRNFPLFESRFTVAQGLTGLAQVQQPADTNLEDVKRKLAYDIYHICHPSLWIDLRILVFTFLRMFGVPYSVGRKLFRLPSYQLAENHYKELNGPCDLAPFTVSGCDVRMVDGPV
jgi:lipopolysaccharide/colanic/teichoic acid biosynthesis glycosyltransferase